MVTIALVFFVAIGLAGLLGWTVDSRDGVGWAPSSDPRRDTAWDQVSNP
jgi:hypothetical protein